MKKPSKKDTLLLIQILQECYPSVTTFLTHETTFQLLIAVILSAQCTDARVNKVTPALFLAYPDAFSMSKAPLESLIDLIKTIHFSNAKAKNILKTCQILCDNYAGQVPDSLDALVLLPGVGRKTANVVLGQAFGKPGITVDTHVKRISQRLGWTAEDDPVKIEFELMKQWPKSAWIDLSSQVILHGRQVCDARKPNCEICRLHPLCQWYKRHPQL